VQTYNQLFPPGHAFYGSMDYVGRQNAIDLSGGLTLAPARGWKLQIANHILWLEDEDDALSWELTF